MIAKSLPGPRIRRGRRTLRAFAALVGAVGLVAGSPSGAGDGATLAAPLAPRPFAPRPAPQTRTVTVQMRPHESLSATLLRAGLDGNDVNGAASVLADDFDIVNPHPGLEIVLTLRVRTARERPLLEALELTPRDDERLGLSREADGTMHLRRVATPVFVEPSLTRGVVHGSLYLSMVEAGTNVDMAAKVARLFGRRVDLARDIESGDTFRLVFDQQREVDGRPVGPRTLLYADITTRAGAARLYRYRAEGARADEWIDGDARPGEAALLRTPVDGARLTSGFGMRMHPLLGYTRMHQGIDFGAPVGTPVLAAGDGVVEEAMWSGGYGRWLKIRHEPDLETGYGHLSAWGPGIKPGAHVRQGQIVAFLGDSGLATGPHLHYEVFASGQRIDPRAAPTLKSFSHDPARDPDFRARRANIDAAVASLAAACAVPGLLPSAQTPRCVG